MLFDDVRDVIVETVGCEAAAVTPEARLNEDLGADSLAARELIMALDEKLVSRLTTPSSISSRP